MVEHHDIDIPYCLIIKAKDHGEGGTLVKPIESNVVIVDDVIAAGTAIRESMIINSMIPFCVLLVG